MKTGYVGLVGLPNAGKSTLVNSLLGDKISIVSRKPQTTRKRVLGIHSDEDSQIIFVDAPGRVKAEHGLNKFLEEEFNSVIEDSDMLIAVLNLDAQQMEPLLEIVDICERANKPWRAVITKDDLNLPHRVAKLREALAAKKVATTVVSALKRPQELREFLLPDLKEKLPSQEQPFYETDITTTQTIRELLAELVREQCFEYLHQEIPYGIATKVTDCKEDDHLIRAHVEIVVAKDNHVGMVVGKGGQTLKRIGASARIEAERILGRKVFLQTQVRCRKDWTNDPKMMKELGYVVA